MVQSSLGSGPRCDPVSMEPDGDAGVHAPDFGHLSFASSPSVMSTPRPQRKTFAELLPQLFLFPLLIVTVLVMVWLLFAASAQDNRGIEELLADIQSGGQHSRKQDTYALAQKAIEVSKEGKHFSASQTRLLLAMLETEKDPKMLEFVTMALGSAGEPNLSLPAMQEMALAETQPEAARMNAVRALGLGRHGKADRAASVLLQVVRRNADAGSWEFRWNALAALANLHSQAAVEPLKSALEDPRRELRWSAACWLAQVYDDKSGMAILRQLLDWKHMDGQVGDNGRALLHEQKEHYMLMALEAIARLEGPAARDVIEEKTRDARSPKVRNAALKLVQSLGPRASLSGRKSGAFQLARQRWSWTDSARMKIQGRIREDLVLFSMVPEEFIAKNNRGSV